MDVKQIYIDQYQHPRHLTKCTVKGIKDYLILINSSVGKNLFLCKHEVFTLHVMLAVGNSCLLQLFC